MSNNIYQAPDSNLVSNSIPDSFYTGSITVNMLNSAAWLSVIYAIMSIPILLLPYSGDIIGEDVSALATKVTTLLSVVLWIYLLFVIKRFMELRFELVSLDIYFKVMVALSIILMPLSFFLEQDSEAVEFSGILIVYLALMVPYGVATIQFGRKLLSVDEPYPYLKPFAWTLIISGVCMGSIILIFAAIPIGVVSDILLALLFFFGKKELESSCS